MNRHLCIIEYDKVLSLVAAYAKIATTRERILSMLPSVDKAEVQASLQQTQEAKKLIEVFKVQPVRGFDPLGDILLKATKGVVLMPVELLKVASALSAFRIAKNSVQEVNEDLVRLKELVQNISYDKKLEDDILSAIISDEEISDNASPKLRAVRQKVLRCKERIHDTLQRFLIEKSAFLQENLITERQGRFVIPVKAESRKSVPGLLHDRSSSGATVFIEPMQVVELNNDLRMLELEEAQEIERILTEFTARVKVQAEAIEISQELCIMLDIVLCKAMYSSDNFAVYPQISAKKEVFLQKARHPLIDKKKVVPITLSIAEGERILLISGPNTGGKTVSLKTVGLFAAMAASGIFVPAEQCKLPLFENIYCDIGDEQSIEQSLSTFSSHIQNLKSICQNLTQNDLVLIDEIGAGTDPQEGSALGIGLVKFLMERQCLAIVTTHFSALKEFALLSDGISNASMEFDKQTFYPTYKVLMGVPGSSNAISMAKNLGLHPTIIEYALEQIDPNTSSVEQVLQKANQALSDAQQEYTAAQIARRSIEEELAFLKREKSQVVAERERIRSRANAETRQLVAAAMSEVHEIIDQIKEKVDEANEKALLEAKHMRNRLQDIAFVAETPQQIERVPLDAAPKIGDEVFVNSLNSVGKIFNLPNNKGEYEVVVGTMHVRAKMQDLSKSILSQNASKPKPAKEVKAVAVERQVKEIKLLGMTVVEAEEALDALIMEAQTLNIGELRIIHGLGTGALRQGVRAYLKRNPQVKSQRPGEYNEGGNGVTFAILK